MNLNATTSKRIRKPGARERFRIVDFTNPSGQTVFCVTGFMPDGRRIRENYKTMQEADARKRELNNKVAGDTYDELAPEQLRDAKHAFTILSEKFPGKTLRWAVEYTILNYRELVQEITVEAAFEQFIARREKQNRRPDTIRDLKGRVGMFARLHGAKSVSTVTKKDCTDFVYRDGPSALNQINDRRTLSNFFNWCISEGFAVTNHMEAVEKPSTDGGVPQVLSLDDCRKLLIAARDFQCGLLLPYFVVSLFAGLRPKEAARLTWDQVDLNDRTIDIGGENTKPRQRRLVKLHETAVEWLLPFASSQPEFTAPRRLFDRVKHAAGFRPERARGEDRKLRPWVQDYLRHTAISMYLAKCNHDGETAAWAGNSPDMIHRHYKKPQKEAVVAAFWALTPAVLKGQIVKFPWVKAA